MRKFLRIHSASMFKVLTDCISGKGDQSGLISLTGAGGKTTLMFSLAKELAGRGKKVLTTTTTKIFMPESGQSPETLISDSVKDIMEKSKSRLKYLNHFSAGSKHLSGCKKLKGLSPDIIGKLHRSSLFDWIIVEADGSAGKSIKASALHEPVIPCDTGHVIAIAGLDAVGKVLEEQTVHRAEIFSKNTGLSLGEKIDEQSVADSIITEMEKIRRLNNRIIKFVFLNKADHRDAEKSGLKIAEILWKEKIFDRIIIGSLKPV